MELLELPLYAGIVPEFQFLAFRKRKSSGSPTAICADLLAEPATTTFPMTLAMSRASIERIFLLDLLARILLISSIPSMRISGPEAVPPKVFNFAPKLLTNIVL